jgi:hypothetical protein
MNIENFKSEWWSFKQMNAAETISEAEILQVINNASTNSVQSLSMRLVNHTFIYLLLIIFCQGC